MQIIYLNLKNCCMQECFIFPDKCQFSLEGVRGLFFIREQSEKLSTKKSFLDSSWHLHNKHVKHVGLMSNIRTMCIIQRARDYSLQPKLDWIHQIPISLHSLLDIDLKHFNCEICYVTWFWEVLNWIQFPFTVVCYWRIDGHISPEEPKTEFMPLLILHHPQGKIIPLWYLWQSLSTDWI